jgi:hypothetical protein
MLEDANVISSVGLQLGRGGDNISTQFLCKGWLQTTLLALLKCTKYL